MGFSLSMKAKGLNEVKTFLGNIQHGFKGVAMEAVNEYLLHQLELSSPPYSYVTRQTAYGQTFVSDAQRRYVMAMIKQGVITPGTPNRTGAIEGAWQTSVRSGTQQTIYNTNPSSVWVYSNTQQANLNNLVGWPKIQDFLAKNVGAAIEYANQKVQLWIRVKQAAKDFVPPSAEAFGL